jgi:DNA-binding response OmpR family regulator
MKRILIIEDDPAIAKGLEAALGAEGYDILAAGDGEKGFQLARRENVDLILLDVMLPLKDGFEVCRDLRAAGIDTPILMLTSKQDEVDKVLGLELGADDYVTKPFALRELLARVKARLRRTTEIVRDLDTIAFDDVAVDFKKQEARKQGVPVRLSAKEYEILKYFAQREGEVITRDTLLDDVWGYEQFPTTRTVDNYILSLRKKIETDPSHPKHLLTIHTAGYKFVK